MKDIWVTPPRPDEIAMLDQRLKQTPDNLFDSDILSYPDKIQFYCARDGEPIVFLPIQNVLMLDSLAVKPGATALEVAKSIEVLIKHIVCKAIELAYNEIYFLLADPGVTAYAERHGFELLMFDPQLRVSLFRLKVAKLMESKQCESIPQLSAT